LPKKSIPQNIDSEARALAELAKDSKDRALAELIKDDAVKNIENVLGGLQLSRSSNLAKQFESAANIFGPTPFAIGLTKVGSFATDIIREQIGTLPEPLESPFIRTLPDPPESLFQGISKQLGVLFEPPESPLTGISKQFGVLHDPPESLFQGVSKQLGVLFEPPESPLTGISKQFGVLHDPPESLFQSVSKQLVMQASSASLHDGLPNALEAGKSIFGLNNENIAATITSFVSEDIFGSSIRDKFNKALHDTYPPNTSLVNFSASLPDTSWVADLQRLTAPHFNFSLHSEASSFPKLLDATAGIIAQKVYAETVAAPEQEQQKQFFKTLRYEAGNISDSLPEPVYLDVMQRVTLIFMLLGLFLQIWTIKQQYDDTEIQNKILKEERRANALAEESLVIQNQILHKLQKSNPQKVEHQKLTSAQKHRDATVTSILIAKHKLLIRTKPIQNANIMLAVDEGSYVEKIDEDGYWLFVKYVNPETGNHDYGWVARRNLILPRNYPRYIEAMQQRESNIPEE